MTALAISTPMQDFTKPGSAGVVTDTLFVNCYWPYLSVPTRIFADGSKGIRVLGNTPANVWFPDDVVFERYYPDALYPAEQAVLKAFPFGRRIMVNLSPPEAAVWLEAYEKAVASFPPTHTVFETIRDNNFLRHKEEKSRLTYTVKAGAQVGSNLTLVDDAEVVKVEYEEYAVMLTSEECIGLVDGSLDEATLRDQKQFLNVATGEPL